MSEDFKELKNKYLKEKIIDLAKRSANNDKIIDITPDDPKDSDIYTKANLLIHDFLESPYEEIKIDKTNGIGDGKSNFTGFNFSAFVPFDKITFKGFKLQYIESVGHGASKEAIKVKKLNDNTELVLIKWYISISQENMENIVTNQKKSEKIGYAVHIHAYEVNEYGSFILMDLVKGEAICIVSRGILKELDERVQFKILEAYVKLGKIKLYQGDTNCGNIYYDSTNDKITIIDDLSEYEEKQNNTKYDFLVNIIGLIAMLQKPKNLLDKYSKKWILKNGLNHERLKNRIKFIFDTFDFDIKSKHANHIKKVLTDNIIYIHFFKYIKYDKEKDEIVLDE